MGYSTNNSAFRFLDLDVNVILKSRDADFFDCGFVSDKEPLKLEDDTKDRGGSDLYEC